MDLKAKSEWDLNEMSRDELVYIWKTIYEGNLSDLGSGYVSATTLRKAIAEKLEAEEGVASAKSSFEFVDIEEAEALDEDAGEIEWYTVPGSSARRMRRK